MLGKIMRRGFLLLLAFCVAGCTEEPPHVTASQKDSLRALFDSKSGVTVPKDRESDFFAIVQVFAASRRTDEYVRGVEFAGNSDATLLFSDGGMHGGGTVTLKKKSRRWTITQKVYFL